MSSAEDESSVTDTEDVMEEHLRGSATSSSQPRLSLVGATLADEMDTAAWTAIGLLAATSLGTLFYLGARIDGLGGRVDSLAARTDARFDRVDARFDHIDARFDALIGRMDTRFDALDARFDALATRFDAHLDRHAG
jgi:hypothetical protein